MQPTILIVDDSPAVHALVASSFDGEPWHICSAYDGTQGLAIAASRGAEVVLLDIDLPDMNGFDVCRHLGQEAPGSAVIFLTASRSLDERVCGLHLGGIDYVTKPFEPAELAQRVRNALRTKRTMDLLPERARVGRPHPARGDDRPGARRPRRPTGGATGRPSAA